MVKRMKSRRHRAIRLATRKLNPKERIKYKKNKIKNKISNRLAKKISRFFYKRRNRMKKAKVYG